MHTLREKFLSMTTALGALVAAAALLVITAEGPADAITAAAAAPCPQASWARQDVTLAAPNGCAARVLPSTPWQMPPSR